MPKIGANSKTGDMMSEKVLKAVEARLDKQLKKYVQNNLAEIFSLGSCKAVAKEIKAGRNVTGNAEFGIAMCIHPKTAPRVDPITLKFSPQTKRGKELDEQFIEKTNLLLETGGFARMRPDLLSRLRKKDKEFEADITARRKSRKK